MSDSKGLRLKPPSPLPQGPVSKVAFKVFLNQPRALLGTGLCQLYVPTGWVLSNMESVDRGKEDTSTIDNQKLIQQAASREPKIDLPTEQAKLLLTRNSQLTKFITFRSWVH